jgi:hypothetical protein
VSGNINGSYIPPQREPPLSWEDENQRFFHEHDQQRARARARQEQQQRRSQGMFGEFEMDMSYEALLALDENVAPLRVRRAIQNDEKYFLKAIRRITYRSKALCKNKHKNKSKHKIKDKSKGEEETETETEKEKEETKEEKEEEEEEEMCSICLDEFEHREKILKIKCGHKYHKACIMNWLKRDTRCPMCRYNLVTQQPAQ